MPLINGSDVRWEGIIGIRKISKYGEGSDVAGKE